MTVNDSASGGLPRRTRGDSAPGSALGAGQRVLPRTSANDVARVVRAAASSTWAWLVRTYATVDPRSLGVCRILLGLLVFGDVARRYKDDPQAMERLARKVRRGGNGNWCSVSMPANDVSESDLRALLRWVLGSA